MAVDDTLCRALAGHDRMLAMKVCETAHAL
jgi:hypothetical protein